MSRDLNLRKELTRQREELRAVLPNETACAKAWRHEALAALDNQKGGCGGWRTPRKESWKGRWDKTLCSSDASRKVLVLIFS